VAKYSNPLLSNESQPYPCISSAAEEEANYLGFVVNMLPIKT